MFIFSLLWPQNEMFTPDFHAVLQVVYRQNWRGRTAVLETNKTSAELRIPPGEDYLIEIKALTEGGDGASSGPIHIPKMSSKFQKTLRRANKLEFGRVSGLDQVRN